MLEHIVAPNLVKHLDANSLLYDLQHGFREKRSTETQLTMLLEDLMKNASRGKQTDLVLPNFSKAFDMVSNEKLLYTLHTYGVRGSCLLKKPLNQNVAYNVLKMEEEREISKEKPNVSKLSRKVGEKNRRDKLNKLLTQLAEEIPTIKCAQRRPDKLAILRLTVSYLKLNNGLKKRKVVSQCLQTHGCLYGAAKQVTDGVMFIMTKSGSILYVSENIQSILGFHQIDVMGFNIEKFIHTADMPTFHSQFSKQTVTLASFEDARDLNEMQSVEVLSEYKNSFYMRMLHASKKRQDDDSPLTKYELMHFSSFLDYGNQEKEHKPWIVAFMKPLGQESIREIEVKVSEFTKSNEFATLHDLDGTILATEHRASLFHGYMKYEMVGKSPYVFILDDDLESIALSHKLILKEDEIPVTTYRMRSRFNNNIYVQSRSVIVCDKWTKNPKCIVSVNTIYTEKDGKRLLKEQKQKLAKLRLLSINDSADNLHKSADSVPDSSTLSQSTDEDYLSQNSDISSVSLDDDNSPTFDNDCYISNTSMSLSERYERQAKTYPELYSRQFSPDESRSNSNSSVKRTFEDSGDGSDDLSDESGHMSNITDKLSRDTFKSRHHECDKTLVDNSIGGKMPDSNADPSKEGIFTLRSSGQGKPILKGLLEGQLTLDEIVHTGEIPVTVPSNTSTCERRSVLTLDEIVHTGEIPVTVPSNTSTCETRSVLTLDEIVHTGEIPVTVPSNTSTCERRSVLTLGEIVHTGEIPVTVPSNTSTCERRSVLTLGEIVHTDEIPVTVPSNTSTCERRSLLPECVSVGNSAAYANENLLPTEANNGATGECNFHSPSAEDQGDQEIRFKDKFALQLQEKHVKLQEALFTQRSTIQYLHTQLQFDPEALSEREHVVHKNLLAKIMEAENQVDEQSKVLREIEAELQDHNRNMTLNSVESGEMQSKR